MVVRINTNVAGRPAGKLANAELHFEDQDGPLSGLKLMGLAVWQRLGGTDRPLRAKIAETTPLAVISEQGEMRHQREA